MADDIARAVTRIPGWETARAVRVAPLVGGLTNRAYRVDLDREAFVVRLRVPGAEVLGIDRRREWACALAASRAGVAPEVVHVAPETGLMVTRFVPGRTLSPGLPAAPEVVRRVVDAVRRYHESPPIPGTFSPLRTIAAYVEAARSRGALPDDLPTLTARLAEVTAVLEPGARLVPCHNDLWGANLIDDGARVWIVDWEYAGLGDPYFDLATFAIYHAPGDTDEVALLAAYFGEVTPARLARLKLMRLVAEMRDATWYLVAQGLSTSAPDFAARADAHLARCRRGLDDPRLPAWLAQARDA